MKLFTLTSALLLSTSIFAVESKVVQLKDAKQYEEILKGDKPAVIKFHAEWCGACKSVKDAYEELAKHPEVEGVLFVEANVDDHQELAQKNGVMGIPTFLFVQNGSVKHQEVGVKDPQNFGAAIRETISKHLSSAKDAVKSGYDKVKDAVKAGYEAAKEELAKEVDVEQTHAQMTVTEEHTVPATGHEMTIIAKAKAMIIAIVHAIKDVIMQVINFIKGLFGK